MGRKRTFTEEEEREVAARYAAGENSQKLAAAYHCHWGVILRAVRNQGGQVRRGGARHLDPTHPRWPGAAPRYIKKRGYVLVYLQVDDPMSVMCHKGGQYASEHRVVMARAIGRPLEPHETVHHINGIKDDNRLENLQLRQGHHGQGVLMHCIDCGSHNVKPRPLH